MESWPEGPAGEVEYHRTFPDRPVTGICPDRDENVDTGVIGVARDAVARNVDGLDCINPLRSAIALDPFISAFLTRWYRSYPTFWRKRELFMDVHVYKLYRHPLSSYPSLHPLLSSFAVLSLHTSCTYPVHYHLNSNSAAESYII